VDGVLRVIYTMTTQMIPFKMKQW